eukprot:TRINITY_DN7893_c0_g1_i3.p1 TRINITY_DN7893_c0_g1~~TRINITY_DN7893_c0_g1_i3.p1  ORF type:complete len:279 (+),score=57.04 TRINITY_DN7893_c0_g1_i3:81-917(+)
MQKVMPMSPGLVLPPGALSSRPSAVAKPCSSPSNTTASTPSTSDAEQQQTQKQKELQQMLAKQRRQLYEKKFEEQHLNRPPRQHRPSRKHGQSTSQGNRSVQGLAALQQQGQALLLTLARGKQPDAKEHEDVLGEPESHHPDRDFESLSAFMPDFCAFRGKHFSNAEATARDGDVAPVILSSSPEQPAAQPDVGDHWDPGYYLSFGVTPAPPPGLAPASLPTLLSRGPCMEKKPSMAVRPPPGLEAPQRVPKTLEWLSQGISDQEPLRVPVRDLASFL